MSKRGRKKALELAKKYGIGIDCSLNFTKWVHPPDWLYPDEHDDPHDDNHYCYDWPEALERVSDYVREIELRKVLVANFPHMAEMYPSCEEDAKEALPGEIQHWLDRLDAEEEREREKAIGAIATLFKLDLQTQNKIAVHIAGVLRDNDGKPLDFDTGYGFDAVDWGGCRCEVVPNLPEIGGVSIEIEQN